MTYEQFAALADLLRLRTGPAQECARFVLVEGLRQVDAAAQTGLSAQGASNAVRRVRAALELAQVAAGQKKPGEVPGLLSAKPF